MLEKTFGTLFTDSPKVFDWSLLDEVPSVVLSIAKAQVLKCLKHPIAQMSFKCLRVLVSQAPKCLSASRAQVPKCIKRSSA